MRFVELGAVPFREAFQLQEEVLEAVAAGRAPETVHLLEHPHVFTLGRRGLEGNLLAETDFSGRPIEAIRINRGGDITYHGPGQIVGYPHLDLRLRNRDLHKYLRSLEEALILTVRGYGIDSFRREGLTGVWTAHGKLASIGVGVRKWITMHGFALNVSTDLRYFQLIHPCGLPDCRVVSLSSLLGRRVETEDVIPVLKARMKEVFELSNS